MIISILQLSTPTKRSGAKVSNKLIINNLSATAKFTFPFCYTPRPEIVAAARRLTARIDASPELRALFAEGKMLGVLMVEDNGAVDFLYAFSGLAGGRNRVDGFVPPIFDLLDPEGHFKQEEARIVALTRRIRALQEPEEKEALVRERRERSVALQEWIFDAFLVNNARGERLSIAEALIISTSFRPMAFVLKMGIIGFIPIMTLRILSNLNAKTSLMQHQHIGSAW